MTPDDHFTRDEAQQIIDSARRATFICGGCDERHPLVELTLDGDTTVGVELANLECELRDGRDPSDVALDAGALLSREDAASEAAREARQAGAVDRATLDRTRCSDPDCTEDHGRLYLHSNCHPDSATWAVYEDGLLRVECAECEREIVTVRVAGDAP
jgi:hypothetical protein